MSMHARTLAAAVLTAISAGAAVAADLPSRKEPPPPPPFLQPLFSWTGAYAGVNVGAALGDGEFAGVVPLIGSNFTGGVTLGYNWAWQQKVVAGVELDADFRGTIDAGQDGLFHAGPSSEGYLGTVRARLGYAIFDQGLVYATAGFAYGNDIAPQHYSGANSPGYAGARIAGDSSLLPGWTAGAGFEYALTHSWSVKVEYLYVELAHFDPRYANAVYPFPLAIGNRSAAHLVRMGLNYRFNWGASAPVIAKF
ncbi:MAG TPA: outer membrane beta-barrel protein [Methylocystis sp.]|nr:outer membrane beta-barrel protein [Methylocystis sp.]